MVEEENANIAEILRAYPYPGPDTEPHLTPQFLNKYTSIAAAALRDYIFTCGSRRVARAITQRGGRVYMYEWTHDITHWLDGLLLGGNYHTSENSFVFANEFPPILHAFTDEDRRMSALTGRRWSTMTSNLSATPP